VTDFLYPFIDANEREPSGLLADLARSVETKAAESADLAASTVAGYRTELGQLAAAIAERAASGGRILTFGNGGSATDAANLAGLLNPLVACRSLVADMAIVTALGNDLGFELVFSRQVIAYGGPFDTAIGYSTSGNSANVIGAFREAKRRGLLTVGFAGYGGGEMASSDAVDRCFVVRSESVHRIQEAQAALSFALWIALRARLGDRGGPA
jgi:D-sedoheptulose 7-phosphate isomerase